MSGDVNAKSGGTSQMTRNIVLLIVIIAAAAGLRNLPMGGEAPQDVVTADWPSYGRDAGGSRFSPVSQINQKNVRNLEVAWVYRTGKRSSSGWRLF